MLFRSKAVQTSNDIFTITLNTNGIRFEIKDEYNAKKQKESCYQYYIHQLHQFVMDFNKTVTSVNVNNSIPARYAEYFNDRQTVDYYRLIHFKDYEVEDLCVFSSTLCTASTIWYVASFNASCVSSDVTSTVFGRPVTRFRPLTFIVAISVLG